MYGLIYRTGFSFSIGLTFFWLSVQHVYAHGFGERYDLPIPLWVYVSGAASVVFISFIIIGLFIRGNIYSGGYPKIDLLRFKIGRLLINPVLIFLVQLLSVLLFVLTVLTGLFGEQTPSRNFTPIMIWIVFWVGFAYFSAFVGNIWYLVNPWNIVFKWCSRIYSWIFPHRRFFLRRELPEALGVWPGVALFFIFAWLELAGGALVDASSPLLLSRLIIAYSGIIWVGMLIYGRDQWLRSAEIFTIVFSLLSKFSFTELSISDSTVCLECNMECQNKQSSCIDCFGCFARADVKSKSINIRPLAVGILNGECSKWSLFTFVILLVSTVTFDGFTATPLWANIVAYYFPLFSVLGSQAMTWITTMNLITFPLIFTIVYLLVCQLISLSTGSIISGRVLAMRFVFSLIPIALAYHVAHFLSFLLIQGQGIIPIISDPFGFGWDLIGTSDYKINISIVSAKFAWAAAIVAIVAGHVVAVYIAHVIALRTFDTRTLALRSQYPMMVFMIVYTVISLWMIAQPIVEI